MQRLLPDPAPTTIEEQLAEFAPQEMASESRPYVFTNFAATVEGRATIEGRSGPIGSDNDTAMLIGLRSLADAVMIGAGTMRAERYGRLVPDPAHRARRERRGLAHDPLAVILTNSMELPWDAGLFGCGMGRVVVFTASERRPPETATPVTVVRHPERIDLAEALRYLRGELGIRALLCEGGPDTHAQMIELGVVDEIFLTCAPKLAGGEGPLIVTGLPARQRSLELLWLLHESGELFARYAVRAD